MKKTLLLLLIVMLFCSGPIFGQQDNTNATAQFNSNWRNYVIPDCSYTVFHGKDGWFFTDLSGNRVPKHLYEEIVGGGNDHFIVRDKTGFFLLDTNLVRVTKKSYVEISYYSRQYVLKDENGIECYSYDQKSKQYQFAVEDQVPRIERSKDDLEKPRLELGKISDTKFKGKRIEKLRLDIPMSQTLVVSQKGKNYLVKKNELVVYKGPSTPMLFYDFMITEKKAPHAVYHSISKKPILENCEQFWLVDSFLVVKIKGSAQKHILSANGEIILSTTGEIGYYEYTHSGTEFSFFCDGRSVVTREGNIVYYSDGELVGVGEHYIYSGYKGAYLGMLNEKVKLNSTDFDRIGNITIAQTNRYEAEILTPESVVLNRVTDYSNTYSDSLLICSKESETVFLNPYTGEVKTSYPVQANLHTKLNEGNWIHVQKWFSDEFSLQGFLHVDRGIVVEPKYVRIRRISNGKYFLVLTEEGKVEYLDQNGLELFD